MLRNSIDPHSPARWRCLECSETPAAGVAELLLRGVGPGAMIQIMETASVDDLDWRKLRSVGALDIEVLPVAVQDADSHEVIMVAYLSPEALDESARSGRAVFYSTSRRQLHRKGVTSGDVLEVVGLHANCDLNSVLMKVRKLGSGACHERDANGDHYPSCFFRPLTFNDDAQRAGKRT